MKRVTISRHWAPDSIHYDVFFETDSDYLITYEILRKEEFITDFPLVSVRKQNHRKIYLDFEGEISNGRGYLTNVWKGTLSNEKTPEFNKIIIEVSGNLLNYKEF